MQITPLRRGDYNEIIDMLILFGHESGISEMIQPVYDREHLRQVVTRCEFSGASWIAYNDKEIMGMILAMRYQDFWIPKIIRMRELAWWVKPNYRGTTAGARLFRNYVESCELLRTTGKIASYTVSKMANSPNFDYERRGFRHVESTYQIGE